MQKIILAGGCFWCTEAIFSSLKGVTSVIPGYSGGGIENPSYYQVASGDSKHAESVEVTYDDKTVDLEKLLYVFFKLHDPTQLNRQGADTGTQYRSAVFYFSENQKDVTEKIIKTLQKDMPGKIVTEVTKYKNFFPADPEHKDYYLKNKGNIYCSLVIDPKIKKLKKEFPGMVQ